MRRLLKYMGVGSVFVIACSTAARDPSSSRPPSANGSDKDRYTLSITATVVNASLHSGDPVLVDVLVDNHKVPPYRLMFPTGCQFTWLITAEGGRVVGYNPICTQATSYLDFDADGLYVRRLSIRTIRDSQVGWPFEEDVLPEGSYQLEVYLSGFVGRMRTQVVEFRVLE